MVANHIDSLLGNVAMPGFADTGQQTKTPHKATLFLCFPENGYTYINSIKKMGILYINSIKDFCAAVNNILSFL